MTQQRQEKPCPFMDGFGQGLGSGRSAAIATSATVVGAAVGFVVKKLTTKEKEKLDN